MQHQRAHGRYTQCTQIALATVVVVVVAAVVVVVALRPQEIENLSGQRSKNGTGWIRMKG